MMADPFDLDRFVEAQAFVYAVALGEVRKGAKRTHWMWFIFPQLAGLGHSPMARHYAIQSIAEAKAYLEHAVLGVRYRECVEALQNLPPLSVTEVFGPIDAMKLHSSLTLFAEVRPDGLFATALERWFEGKKDMNTVRRLSEKQM